jgi:glucosamine--fructose-6-phosphate aminotransferase (isomerizing)
MTGAVRGGPTTWMAREIAETPMVVDRLVRDEGGAAAEAAEAIRRFGPRWVTFVGRGTSLHAAIYGRYLVETELGWPSRLAAASVTTVYGRPIHWSGGLVIAISQSGQGPDTIEVVEAARSGGALTVVITNDRGSPLAAAGEVVVPLDAGPERSLAATKTYVATLVIMAILVDRLAGARRYGACLATIPSKLEAVSDAGRAWLAASGIVSDVAGSAQTIVTSRGHDLATALEIGIKLQETSALFVDARSTAELEHGPIVLAGLGAPVLVIRPDGTMGRRVDGALERMRAIGARPWVIGGQEAPAPWAIVDPERSIQLPVDVPAALGPLLRVVPGQWLAEGVARARGRDPDRPAGLTKVTRTH